ncbi:FixH family protein [Sphingobium fuliginis]|uniref:Type cbb3 cytochrome oxidase biogenesis protein CcoH n=2 Tax=Sphingobium fuliginis (strain ATCC 27551) TaxID=336203 RepID=A0A292ZMD2_SPHSA|nr:FixH family protein [Sphingobium fuliginis]QDC39563.1 FixH family protein [Sphingobium fuliginis ATCC 27551]GAY24039.1 type cbb3 cytochrome oxidase biogenesis protein CcoH [Sphingobium fuliginis]
MTPAPSPIRRFTGWHMTAILVAFFAVVIAVNMLMATVAVRSFGGTVVENSYVASQKFNGWLAEARAQKRLGWRDAVTLDAARHVGLTLADARGAPVAGGQVTAVAQHPLGRTPDLLLAFRETAPGVYASDRALPEGRWQIRFDLHLAGREEHLLREVD